MTEDREDLFRILHTYDLRQCTVTLRPSAIPSENVIEIVETVVDNSSFFVFSRTSERRSVYICFYIVMNFFVTMKGIRLI